MLFIPANILPFTFFANPGLALSFLVHNRPTRAHEAGPASLGSLDALAAAAAGVRRVGAHVRGREAGGYGADGFLGVWRRDRERRLRRLRVLALVQRRGRVRE